MKQITQIGATKEEAIQLALQQLGTTREQVNVEVLQEGKKGFLGFGARPAEVRVSIIEQKQQEEVVQVPIEEEPTVVSSAEQVVVTPEVQVTDTITNPIAEAKAYIMAIARDMGVEDLHITHHVDGKHIQMMLASEKAALLIGKRGQTLNALQQLTQLILNKSAQSFTLLELDVEQYRERRRQALEQLAERMADKALRTGKKVVLEPMPSYERKIIHHQLTNRLDIETYSEGVEPNRYLVIERAR